MSAINSRGVRTVTMIVTHEDESRDFSRTYTARQIKASPLRREDEGPIGRQTDWAMTTFEDQNP